MEWIVSLLFSNYGVAAVGAAGAIGLVWFASALNQKIKDNDDRRERETQALKENIQQLEKINEAQANPFPDTQSANNWVRKYRNKTD